jgi:predicted Fe-S protein YdhL (DUF1289 family)
MAEIAAWPSLTAAERKRIMATLEAREEAVLFCKKEPKNSSYTLIP